MYKISVFLLKFSFMTSIQTLYQLFLESGKVTTDTRNCPKGSIFFALKGDNFDGNLFASKALENGCSHAVVDNPDVVQGSPYILVEDVLSTLQALAKEHRKHLVIPIIGITGTNGKTTTKELMAAVLSKKYQVLYTQGNLNNHIGVPLTLLRIGREHEMAIIEMGANHPGEIGFLCDIALPNHGLITNIGKAHLEGFGSFQGVIQTKSELYRHLKAHQGHAFVNRDNDLLFDLSSELETTFYGTTNTAHMCGGLVSCEPFLKVQWQDSHQKSQQAQTQLIGAYNLENVLAAICVGQYFRVSSAQIVEALEAYAPGNNRSQFKQTENNALIIDAYNANPTSMMAAIDNFKNIGNPHKAVILGSMKELGDQSMEEHQKVIQALKLAQVDLVYLIGKEFEACGSPFETFVSTNAFLDFLQQHPIQSHLILIKGSRSNQLETLIPHL